MKYFLNLFVLTCILTTTAFPAIDTDKLTIGGTYLGVFNSFEENQTQFDYAANIDFSYSVNNNLTTQIQLQTGAGNGSIGLGGPQVALKDIVLIYTPKIKGKKMNITFGSFDTPFGFDSNNISNNADTFNTAFILNSLPYSALDGQMSQLNTLGLKLENSFKYLDLTTVISNGTSETAYNESRTFEKLTQLSFHSFIKNLRITGSIFNSDDLDDTQDSLQANVDATLVEVNYNLLSWYNFKYKVYNFYFDDGTSAEDNTKAYEFEINYDKNPIIVGLRASFWRPESATMSAATPSPSLLSTASNTDKVDRYQLTTGYYIDPNILIKLELVSEVTETNNGSSKETNNGFITGVNVRF